MKPSNIAGVLLGGGQARRMGGGDKCLCVLAGKTLLDHVIARLRPQVGPLLLNANGDAARFARFGLPVVADVVPGFAGPLAGVLSGMEWASADAPDCPRIVTVATDAPFLPLDLVARLSASAGGADIVCAQSGGRAHPVIALWPVSLRHELRHAIVVEGIRKVDRWSRRYAVVTAEFAAEPVDPFFNVNTVDDLLRAEELVASNPNFGPPR